MFGYIIRRLGGAIIVLIGISIITFILAYAVPIDPAKTILGTKASPAAIAALRHQLGLDQPLPLQYIHYLGRLLHGDLGTSYTYNQSVAFLIGQRLGPSTILGLCCWLCELIIGIPLGIYTARRARKLSDYIVSVIALFGISISVPWLALLLLYEFAFQNRWFPLGGSGGIMHLILPSITIGITGAAFYMRILKSSMMEVLNQDYIRTARAKGANENRVVWRHAVRNAMIPVVTFAGIDIGQLLGGIVLLEVAFNWNGVGILAYDAINQLDIPIIMGTVLLAAVFVVVFNFIVDIAYVFIDPRIRYQ